MAFTGYNFQSFEEIEPFIESEVDGLSVMWAKRTASRLQCHVLIGFAQRIVETTEKKCYNALAIVSHEAELLTVYHKTQLYPPVDPLWAKAGEGFLRIDLRIGRSNGGKRYEPVKCCVGICMDLSPDRFEAPFEAYELSTFSTQQDAEILLCPMAWLDSDPGSNPNQTRTGKSWEEVSQTLNYWAARCEPMWKRKDQTFVACNRVGYEDPVHYTGTSCVISNVQDTSNSTTFELPTVLAYASKHLPELLITHVPLSTPPD